MTSEPLLHDIDWGLGTAPLGDRHVSIDEARRTVRAAVTAGWRLIDSAPYYGRGEAERLLGHALEGMAPGSYVISTKVGRVIEQQGNEATAIYDFTARGVRRSLTDSLSRLRLDRVDIALIHDPDEQMSKAVEEAYGALVDLRAEGLVSAIGVGMNDASLATEFVRAADLDCVLIAGRYSLLDQSAANELFPACVERGTRVVLGGVFNSGILVSLQGRPTYDYAPATSSVLQRARRLEAVCRRYNIPLAAAALAFAASHPAVTTVLMGCKSSVEVDENASFIDTVIPPALWHELRAEGLIPPNIPTPGSHVDDNLR